MTALLDNILSGSIAGAYFLTALLLVLRSGLPNSNQTANRWLALILCCVGIEFLEPLLLVDDLFPNALSLLPIELPYAIFGPAAYFTVVYYVFPGKRLRSTELLLGLPALFLFLVILYLQFSGWQDSDGADTIYGTTGYVGMQLILLLLTIACVVASIVRLRRHQYQRQQILADAEQGDLTWLLRVFYALPVLLLVWVNALVPAHRYEIVFLLIPLALICYVAYYALFQPKVYDVPEQREYEILEVLTAKTDGSPPLLSDLQVAAFAKTLDAKMLQDQPFRQQKLTLLALADAIEIRPQELSYLLNHIYGENFYAFINRHRVDFAKTLLTSPEHTHLNLVGVAAESGFGSKSTFNSAFKALTTLTPSAWRKQHRNPIDVQDKSSSSSKGS